MAQFNVNYFETIDDEQKAYILGFLQSDGSFSCKGRISGYYRYKLAIQEGDIEILHKMQACLGHTGKVSTQIARKEGRQNIAELSLNGRLFAESLHDIFGGYLKEERTNFPILESHLLRHYIRGVVDADGSFGDYQGVMIRISGKKPFLESIKEITGFEFYLSKGHGATTHTLRANGSEGINVIEWLYTGLSRESLYLNRKLALATSVLSNRGVNLKEAA